MSYVCAIDEIHAPGRRVPSPARLDEHLRMTEKRLKLLGLGSGDAVASLLPEGPDAATARIALRAFSPASLVPLATFPTADHYLYQLTSIGAKLLLMHPGDHPAKQAARALNITIANVLRHFEAGVFTLEAAIAAPPIRPEPLSWKRSHSLPLVLISPSLAYRRLSSRLDPHHPVIGITPPSLELLPPPHTIEHIAAESARMLRRYRPQGPYALAGWHAEAFIALEMARVLEEGGEKVAFVAMLDAAEYSRPPATRWQRVLSGWLPRKPAATGEFMSEALNRYQPRPWFGKVIQISPHEAGRCEWSHIAPQGLKCYNFPAEIQAVAQILARELGSV